jgi:hypothetical protein
VITLCLRYGKLLEKRAGVHTKYDEVRHEYAENIQRYFCLLFSLNSTKQERRGRESSASLWLNIKGHELFRYTRNLCSKCSLTVQFVHEDWREHVLDMCRSFAVRIISSLKDLYFTLTSNEAVFKKKLQFGCLLIFLLFLLFLISKYFKSHFFWKINLNSSHHTLFSELSPEYVLLLHD